MSNPTSPNTDREKSIVILFASNLRSQQAKELMNGALTAAMLDSDFDVSIYPSFSEFHIKNPYTTFPMSKTLLECRDAGQIETELNKDHAETQKIYLTYNYKDENGKCKSVCPISIIKKTPVGRPGNIEVICQNTTGSAHEMASKIKKRLKEIKKEIDKIEAQCQ
jgi:hypothetical protein